MSPCNSFTVTWKTKQNKLQIKKNIVSTKMLLEFLAKADLSNQSNSEFHPLKDCFHTQKMTQHAED